MSVSCLLLAAVGLPILHAALLPFLARPPGLRDVSHILFALAQACACALLVARVSAGDGGRASVGEPLPGLDLALGAEPLGVAFAALASALGFLCALYTAGWMRLTRDPAPTRFMAFSALALSATAGVALAANLFTFYVFYAFLTVTIFPLLAHRGDEKVQRSGAIFLVTTLALATGALLPAIIWTGVVSGDLDFVAGGLLAGRVDALSANILLALYVLGLGLAALFPVHRWITAAADAPAPAAALILAVTAASVGGFGVLRIVVFVFGPALEDARIAATAVLALAIATLIGASMAAFSRREIHARLASLCVAQLSAVTAGAMLGPTGDPAIAAGWFGAALQLVAYGAATATLCFAFGVIEAATGATAIDDLAGLGRIMPLVFVASALGALSFAGAPPLAGAFPKLWLMIGSANHREIWAGLAIAAGALLAFAALAAPLVRALFAPAPQDRPVRPDRAPLLMLAPTLIAGVSTLLLLVWLDRIALFLGLLRGEAL